MRLSILIVLTPLAAPFTSPAFATAPKYDVQTCAELRQDYQRAAASGLAARRAHGPEWARDNLSGDQLRELQIFIELDEQIKFGCRDATITLDAERAANFARRIELNPDADPDAPLPKIPPAEAGTGGAGDEGAPPSQKPKPRPPKAKSKAKDPESAGTGTTPLPPPPIPAPATP